MCSRRRTCNRRSPRASGRRLEARPCAVDDCDVAADLRDTPEELRKQRVDRRLLLGRVHLHDAEIDRAGRRLPRRVDRNRPRVRRQLQRTGAQGAAAYRSAPDPDERDRRKEESRGSHAAIMDAGEALGNPKARRGSRSRSARGRGSRDRARARAYSTLAASSASSLRSPRVSTMCAASFSPRNRSAAMERPLEALST